MSYDVFGDLQEWGRVLDRIRQMRPDGAFDDHQPGLVRLARYRFNWQLRHAALRAIAELERPGDEAVEVAVQITMDEKNDLETRILAGHAVSGVLQNGNGRIGERARFEAVRSIRGSLAQPQPPVLHARSHAAGHRLNPKEQTRPRVRSKEAEYAGYRFGFARRRAPRAWRADGATRRQVTEQVRLGSPV